MIDLLKNEKVYRKLGELIGCHMYNQLEKPLDAYFTMDELVGSLYSQLGLQLNAQLTNPLTYQLDNDNPIRHTQDEQTTRAPTRDSTR